MKFLRIIFFILNLNLALKILGATSSSSSSNSTTTSLSSSSSNSTNSFINNLIVIQTVKRLLNISSLEGIENDPYYLLFRALDRGNSPLDPVNFKAKSLILLLSNFKFDLNRQINGRFPLEIANSFEKMKLLLDAGANLDQQDENGDSLLLRQLSSISPSTIYLTLIQFLLQNGANPNEENPNTRESFLSRLNSDISILNKHDRLPERYLDYTYTVDDRDEYEKNVKKDKFTKSRELYEKTKEANLKKRKEKRKEIALKIRTAKGLEFLPPGLPEEIASYII